jgi:hypothetical protein
MDGRLILNSIRVMEASKLGLVELFELAIYLKTPKARGLTAPLNRSRPPTR